MQFVWCQFVFNILRFFSTMNIMMAHFQRSRLFRKEYSLLSFSNSKDNIHVESQFSSWDRCCIMKGSRSNKFNVLTTWRWKRLFPVDEIKRCCKAKPAFFWSSFSFDHCLNNVFVGVVEQRRHHPWHWFDGESWLLWLCGRLLAACWCLVPAKRPDLRFPSKGLI